MDNPFTRRLELPRPPAWLVRYWPLIPAALVLLTLLGTHAGQTPDSIKYLAAAQSLRSGAGLGASFLLWPPLYPAVLALSPDPIVFAAWIGNAGAVATVIGVWAIGRRQLPPVELALVLLALVAIDRFGALFGFAWSETLFIPFSVWLAVSWMRYLETGRGLLVPCTLLALALLTRHVGVVLAVAMAITAPRVRALAAIGVACVPYALWLSRTYALCGSPFGPRPPLAHPDLMRQLSAFGGVWGHWLLPHAYWGGAVLGIVVFMLIVTACFLVRGRGWCFLALALLGHSALTVYSASRLSLDVDARTLFPVYWIALLLVARAAQGSPTWLRWAFCGYLLVWFAAPNAIVNALVAF